jgi:CheB methylesterase
VRKRKLHLSDDPERYSCRPSVDVLLDSIAAECGAGGIGCLLTGMGQDGARGWMAIRRAGGFTIAQDEATSVVYGMPRERVVGRRDRRASAGRDRPETGRTWRGASRSSLGWSVKSSSSTTA